MLTYNNNISTLNVLQNAREDTTEAFGADKDQGLPPGESLDHGQV